MRDRVIQLRLIWLVFALVASVISHDAAAGPPAPQLTFEVWPVIPRNGHVNVDITANCTARMPLRIHKTLQLYRGKSQIKGRWYYVKRIQAASGQQHRRLRFVSSRSLPPGQYRVVGFPKDTFAFVNNSTFQIMPISDRQAPRFQGLTGVRCVSPHPLAGCAPYGIYLRAGKAKDLPRLVSPTQGNKATSPGAGFRQPKLHYKMYLRKRGGQYDRQRGWEVGAIPLHARPFGRRIITPGQYIITLRARDLANYESGRICEFELRLPVLQCAAFAKRQKLPTTKIWRRETPWLKSRCARWDPTRKVWNSAIDGVSIRFPGHP